MKNGVVDLSIVICTHNRSADVIECLNALAHRELPDGYEVILVDSGSASEDADRIRDFVETSPFIRFQRLDVPGTSLARNTGLAMARGEWVWWLDDDAIPDERWPEQLKAVLMATDARTAVIGGQVIPMYPPDADTGHLTDRWKLLLSCMTAEEEGDVANGFNVACANMLMRREPALAIGGFSSRIGRVGAKDLVSGEENLVIEMLRDHGYGAKYTPILKVRHKVAGTRLRLDWLARRAYAEGVSIYTIGKVLNRKTPLAQTPLKLHASLWVLNLLRYLFPQNPDWLIRQNIARGMLAGGRSAATPSH